MSRMLPADNQYLTFSLPSTDENDWLIPTTKTPAACRLVVAVVVSLLAHVVLIPWIFSFYLAEPSAYVAKHKAIHLTISRVGPDSDKEFTAVTVEAIPPGLVISEPIDSNVIAAIPSPQPNAEDAVVNTENLPHSINPAQLQSVIQQHNPYGNAYLPTESENGLSAKPQAARHFNNVFHPGLRARLQNNVMHRSESQHLAGTETISIYAETYIELERGRCMMTELSTGPSQPTDWYMTLCPGYQDEGEEIMGRMKSGLRKIH